MYTVSNRKPHTLINCDMGLLNKYNVVDCEFNLCKLTNVYPLFQSQNIAVRSIVMRSGEKNTSVALVMLSIRQTVYWYYHYISGMT